MYTATTLAAVTIFVPLGIERLVVGTALVPFAVTAALALAAYAFSIVRLRERLLIDRLVADIRRPRRSGAAQ